MAQPIHSLPITTQAEIREVAREILGSHIGPVPMTMMEAVKQARVIVEEGGPCENCSDRFWSDCPRCYDATNFGCAHGDICEECAS